MNLYLYKNLTSLTFLLKTTALPHLYKSNLSFSSSTYLTQKSISITDYLINQHGFSQKTALKASSVLPRIKKPEKSDSLLCFLQQSGFSNTHIEKFIQLFPKGLTYKPEAIKSRMKVFQDLGFLQNEVADIISSNPWTLKRSVDKQLLQSMVTLKNVVGTNSNIVKVLKGSAWLLHHDLHKTMIPIMEVMKSCGISRSRIAKYLLIFPRLFTFKPDTIKAVIKRVDALGVERSSNAFFYAIRTLSSMTIENWELKFQIFRRLGWSENDALSMFRRMPCVFCLSSRKIVDGAEFLLGTGKYDVSFLIHHPEVLIYSLEGTIKPRVKILEILVSKDLVSKVPGLLTICKMKNEQFYNKYVLPYENEVGHLYKASPRK